MKKRVILSEAQLHSVINEAVKRILKEGEDVSKEENSISVASGKYNGRFEIHIFVPFEGSFNGFRDEQEKEIYNYVCLTLYFFKGEYCLSSELCKKPNMEYINNNQESFVSCYSSWLSGGIISCSYKYTYRYSKNNLKKLGELLVSLGKDNLIKIANNLMKRNNRTAFEMISPLTKFLEE